MYWLWFLNFHGKSGNNEQARLHDVLGVEKGADDKAIKSAFRKLAMADHPDNQGDTLLKTVSVSK